MSRNELRIEDDRAANSVGELDDAASGLAAADYCHQRTQPNWNKMSLKSENEHHLQKISEAKENRRPYYLRM